MSDADKVADLLSGQKSWVVLAGDCRGPLKLIGPQSVDLILTDPPYSERTHKGQTRAIKGKKGSAKADLGFEPLSSRLRADCAKQFARIANAWVLTFSDAESTHLWQRDLEAEGLNHVRRGVWVKPDGQPQYTGDRPAVGHEEIEIAHVQGGRMKWNGGGLPATWVYGIARDSDPEGRVHSTQKPLDLMLKMVSQFSNEGDLIVDAFCGSGQTGLAAVRLGRRFLGIELDEGKAAEAAERIDAESHGTTVSARKAGQVTLFDVVRAAKQ